MQWSFCNFLFVGKFLELMTFCHDLELMPSILVYRGIDMDVDMDVDMETEDQNNIRTSAVAKSVDHDVPNALPASLLCESTVLQPLVYMPPLVPQVVSYGHIEPLPKDTYIPPAQSLPPLSETPLFPVAPLFPSVASVFPPIQSSVPLPQADSWVPPPPPEEEWAPPPLPDHEAPPPPPDEDEPPLPSASDINALDPPYLSSSAPVLSSKVYHPVETNNLSQGNNGSERHTDSARFGVDPGLIHVNGNAVPPSVVSTGVAETTTKKSSSKGKQHIFTTNLHYLEFTRTLLCNFLSVLGTCFWLIFWI